MTQELEDEIASHKTNATNDPTGEQYETTNEAAIKCLEIGRVVVVQHYRRVEHASTHNPAETWETQSRAYGEWLKVLPWYLEAIDNAVVTQMLMRKILRS